MPLGLVTRCEGWSRGTLRGSLSGTSLSVRPTMLDVTKSHTPVVQVSGCDGVPRLESCDEGVESGPLFALSHQTDAEGAWVRDQFGQA